MVTKFYRDAGTLNAYRDENSNKRAVFFAVMHFNEMNKQIFNQVRLSSYKVLAWLLISAKFVRLLAQDYSSASGYESTLSEGL
jgi:hypothetical protein